MNHKWVAQCPEGHTTFSGTCKAEVRKFFGGTKVCGSKGFDQAFGGGGIVSIRCLGCKTVYTHLECETCGREIPVSAYNRKGVMSHLG